MYKGSAYLWKRAILLVDMNAFFAQLEQLHNPWLRGKPLLVGGNPKSARTVVAAASYEAKQRGVSSGISFFEARALCPGALAVEGNPDKYLHYSRELLKIYRKYTDLVEPYSIDEAFLDVTGVQKLFGSPEAIARAIKRDVRRELGLTCSVGVAPNKLLAKMASNREKPDGLTVWHSFEVPQVMWDLPVRELFGVGARLEQHLLRMGVKSIGELARVSQEVLHSKFGRYGVYLSAWARGEDPSPVNPECGSFVQSVGKAITLPEDTESPEVIRWFLFTLADQVARRVRQLKLSARTVTLTVRRSDFCTMTHSRTLPSPLFLPQPIAEVAFSLFLEERVKEPVRLVGVSLHNLVPSTPQQLTFFSPLRLQKAVEAMDAIRDKYGEEAITFCKLSGSRKLQRKVGAFLHRGHL